MKHLTIFVAIVLFSSCVTSQFLDPTDGEEFQWSGYAQAPSPVHKHSPNQELKECFSSYKMVTNCLMKTLDEKTTVGSECCTMIKKLKENCKHTVFKSFRNPFVTNYVKKHCSSHDATAPSPA
ncbi:putative membrane lipoprotein [Raphanus sativus]|nr:putative membrane lipoprotein [Raphanus sativus]KAJ4908102.1 putative membrane lipoprotein [Raphanus sativus]